MGKRKGKKSVALTNKPERIDVHLPQPRQSLEQTAGSLHSKRWVPRPLFSISINCPHRELRSVPLALFIAMGVAGICAFLFCAYIWIWGLPTHIVEKDQITTDDSVIVGVFSLLVTLLVTWQIWQSVISHQQVQDLRGEIETRAQSTMNIDLYHVFFLHGKNEHRIHHPENALNYYIRSLECGVNGDIDKAKIQEIFLEIEKLVSTYDWMRISESNVGYYISIIDSVDCHNKNDIIKFIESHKGDPVSSSAWGKRYDAGMEVDVLCKENQSAIERQRMFMVCPICGNNKIVYSQKIYQQPFNEKDYDGENTEGHMSYMTPARCLYGECTKCGFVVLRNINTVLSNAE